MLCRKSSFLAAVTALLACGILPAAAPAQTPSKPTPRKVSIQVAFVSVDVTDLDALGVNFDLVPLPAPPHTSLKYGIGNIVSQLYQTLTRTHGHAILIAPAMALDNTPKTLAIDAKGSDYTYPVTMQFQRTIPKLLDNFEIQGKLILTPHIGPDGFISLDIVSSQNDAKPVHLKTIPTGGSLVIIAPHLQGTKTPILSDLLRRPAKLPDTEELLIFITPTILTNAPAQMPTPVPEKRITLNVVNGDLHTIVGMLERQDGIQCLVRDGEKPYGVMSVSMTDVPLSIALRQIASGAKAQVAQNAEGVYVFTPLDTRNLTPQPPLLPMPQAQFSNDDFGFSGFSATLPRYSTVFQHTKPIGASSLTPKQKEKSIGDFLLPARPVRFYAVD